MEVVIESTKLISDVQQSKQVACLLEGYIEIIGNYLEIDGEEDNRKELFQEFNKNSSVLFGLLGVIARRTSYLWNLRTGGFGEEIKAAAGRLPPGKPEFLPSAFHYLVRQCVVLLEECESATHARIDGADDELRLLAEQKDIALQAEYWNILKNSEWREFESCVKPMSQVIEAVSASLCSPRETIDRIEAEAARLPEDESEGPVAPGSWRGSDGKVHSGMRPIAWNLAEYLWKARRNSATIDELAAPLLGDAEEFLEESQLKNAQRTANQFFRSSGLPIHIGVSTTSNPTQATLKKLARFRKET